MTRPGELKRAWLAAGLTDVVETTLSIRMEYASFDDYWAPYLGKDGPQGSTLPRSAKPSARNFAMP